MYCGRCGTQNQDDYKFCKTCGADLRLSLPAVGTPVVSQEAAVIGSAAPPLSAALKTEAERLLTYLTPLVWASSILWGLIGVAQLLVGLIAPQESTTIGGVLNLSGRFWTFAIGAVNLAGAIWSVVQVRRAERGDSAAYKKLRDIARESTIFLGVQALGVASVSGAAGLICFGPLLALEGVAWYLSQRLLTAITRLSRDGLPQHLPSLNSLKEPLLKFAAARYFTRFSQRPGPFSAPVYESHNGQLIIAFVERPHAQGMQQMRDFGGLEITVIVVCQSAVDELWSLARESDVFLYELDRGLRSHDPATTHSCQVVDKCVKKSYGITFKDYDESVGVQPEITDRPGINAESQPIPADQSSSVDEETTHALKAILAETERRQSTTHR